MTLFFFFFFQAEDGIRDVAVTGVQTCALPISRKSEVRLVFLGTGTSYGVPQIGCSCRTCTSADPRDKRTRTAALIESGGRRLLIDTPPELRLQLVAAGVTALDAVLFTHPHADHVHRIDDLPA